MSVVFMKKRGTVFIYLKQISNSFWDSSPSSAIQEN